MAQENVEVVRRVYDALTRRDLDAAFRDMHPDVEMNFQRAPGAGTLRQREAVKGFLEDYLSAFDSMTFEPEQLLENGDQIVALVTRRARPKGGSGEMVVQTGTSGRFATA
jgi:ketosteroid isomerase-like protein